MSGSAASPPKTSGATETAQPDPRFKNASPPDPPAASVTVSPPPLPPPASADVTANDAPRPVTDATPVAAQAVNQVSSVPSAPPSSAVSVTGVSPPPDVSAAQKGETGGTDSTPWYKHPLMLRAAERAAYALASAVIGAALLYADARLKQDVIKRRLWRRRKGRREGEEERRGGSGEKREDGMFRGLGRHLVLAVSVSLKLCAGVALALALVAIAAAIVPGLELRLRVFTAKLPGSGFAHTSDNDDNSDDSDDDNYAYPKFFKQFFGTAIALLLPTAVLVLGTCISAAVLEAKVIVDRIFDRMLFEGAQRAGSLGGGRVSSDRIMAATASTPPLFSQQGADSVAASRSPPWKKYMALHALEGLVIGVFVYFVAYAPFGRELKKLRTIRECPSTASLSKLWSFRDWPSLSA